MIPIVDAAGRLQLFACTFCPGVVRRATGPGRTVVVAGRAVVMPDDVPTFACPQCGEGYFNGENAGALDDAAEKAGAAADFSETIEALL